MTDAQPWQGRRMHFVGAGGAGMSGLALIAKQMGAEVSGCDCADSPYLALLREQSIDVAGDHDPGHVGEADELVISSAIPADLPELEHARKSGNEIIHRAEVLAEAVSRRPLIAVSGTHGKTTTAAMIAHCFRALDVPAGYAIGAELHDEMGRSVPNATRGEADWFVLEADESDRSFLRFRPKVGVVTSIELDHHANYASERDLREAFEAFASQADVLVAWEPLGLRATTTFGLGPNAVVRAIEPVYEGLRSRFTIDSRGERASVELPVPGEHNVLNASAALAACQAADLDLQSAAAALESFRAVGRRFEMVGQRGGAAVIDDYAHHPTELHAALEAAGALDHERLIAVFQPHLYSRTQYLHRQFGQALAGADEVVVLDVYPARERPEGTLSGVTGKLVVDAAVDARPGRPVWWLPTLSEAREVLDRRLEPGTVIITLGAGDVTELAHQLVEGKDR